MSICCLRQSLFALVVSISGATISLIPVVIVTIKIPNYIYHYVSSGRDSLARFEYKTRVFSVIFYLVQSSLQKYSV